MNYSRNGLKSASNQNHKPFKTGTDEDRHQKNGAGDDLGWKYRLEMISFEIFMEWRQKRMKNVLLKAKPPKGELIPDTLYLAETRLGASWLVNYG